MARMPFASFRARLLTLVLLAVIPIIGLTVYTAWEYRRVETAQTQETSLRLTRSAAADVERTVEGVRQVLVALAQIPAVRSRDPAECHIRLAEVLRGNPHYTNFGVADRTGKVVCSARTLPWAVSAADKPWFQRAMQTRAFAVGTYQVDRTTPKAAIVFGYPVLDSLGRMQGVVFAALDVAWLNRSMAQPQLPAGAALIALDRTGTIVVHTPNPERWVGLSSPDAPLIKTMRARGKGTTEVRGMDGVSRLYAFTPLDPGLNTGLAVGIGVPKEPALADANRVFLPLLAGVGLITVLAFVVVWVGGKRFFLRRVQALVSAAKRVTVGDLHERTRLQYGTDELSQLARTFDEMVESLEHRLAERRMAEEALKAQVRRQAAVVDLGQRPKSRADVSALMYEAAAFAARALKIESCAVWELQSDGNALGLRTGVGWKDGYVGHATVGIGTDSHPGYTLLTNEPVLFENLQSETRFSESSVLRDHDVVSGMSAVLKGRDWPFGVLGVYTTKRRAFTKDDVQFVQSVASVLSKAIERKQTEDALRQYSERLDVLHEIDRALLAAQSPESIAQAALRHIRRLVPCVRASIVVFDFKAEEATLLASHINGEITVKERVHFALEAETTEELRQGKGHNVEDIMALGRPSSLDQALWAEGVHSYINMPLVSQGELIGCLIVGADHPKGFASEHVEITRKLADQLTVAFWRVGSQTQFQLSSTELEQRVAEYSTQLQDINTQLETFSRDLRAPLRAMEGYADALREDYADRLDPVGQEYLQRILTTAQRMNTLIQDLMTYSRLNYASLPLRPVSLASIVYKAQTQLEPELTARAAQITTEEPLPPVIGHPATLVQVIVNLLSNAITFVAAGVPPRVRVWAETRDTLVRLWVEDNGIGIAAEHHDQIFRVFGRLHGLETYPGTGMGLAIVRKGIERMGGRVGVESAVGQGSRFWIELPAEAAVALDERTELTKTP